MGFSFEISQTNNRRKEKQIETFENGGAHFLIPTLAAAFPFSGQASPPATAPTRGRVRPVAAVASATTSDGGGGTADDYHSTIRSLNSRGRHVPRKSLGQVRPTTVSCLFGGGTPSPKFSSRLSLRCRTTC